MSKAAVEVLNTWAVQYKFSGRPVGTVRNEFADLELHIGMRVMLTKNLNKEAGLCNGRAAEVTEFADGLIHAKIGRH